MPQAKLRPTPNSGFVRLKSRCSVDLEKQHPGNDVRRVETEGNPNNFLKEQYPIHGSATKFWIGSPLTSGSRFEREYRD